MVTVSAPSATAYFVASSRTIAFHVALSRLVPSNSSPDETQPHSTGSGPSSMKYSNGTSVPSPWACGAIAKSPKSGSAIPLVTGDASAVQAVPSSEYSPA